MTLLRNLLASKSNGFTRVWISCRQDAFCCDPHSVRIGNEGNNSNCLLVLELQSAPKYLIFSIKKKIMAHGKQKKGQKDGQYRKETKEERRLRLEKQQEAREVRWYERKFPFIASWNWIRFGRS
jgi:hypothetical protein